MLVSPADAAVGGFVVADVHACRRHGRYSGFPNMGIKYQRMESTSMRSFYGMRADQKGVLVRHVAPTAPAAGLVRADDILMSFDGVQIANDATVPFRWGSPPLITLGMNHRQLEAYVVAMHALQP